MKFQKHLNLKYLTSGSSDLFLPPYLNNCVKTEDKKNQAQSERERRLQKKLVSPFSQNFWTQPPMVMVKPE